MSPVKDNVLRGGIVLFVPVAACFATASLVLPAQTMSQIDSSNTLLSTIVLLFLYRGTIGSAFSEREDVGYMWFCIGFGTLCAATVLNVSYATFNFAFDRHVFSQASRFLSVIRLMYVFSFWSFVLAKFASGDRMPPKGWQALAGIVGASFVVTSGLVAFRGHL